MNKIEPMRQYLDEKAKFPKEKGAKQPDTSNILTVIALLFAVFIIILVIGKFIQ